jgi:hypothetical protein
MDENLNQKIKFSDAKRHRVRNRNRDPCRDETDPGVNTGKYPPPPLRGSDFGQCHFEGENMIKGIGKNGKCDRKRKKEEI